MFDERNNITEFDLINNTLKDSWNERKRQLYIEQTNKGIEKSNFDSKRVEDKYYDLLKNSTILSGTVFASSISLSLGRSVNELFILGELLLFISTFFGVMYIWAHVANVEWSYLFDSKLQIESDIMLYGDIIDKFILDAKKDLLKNYERLLNRKPILWHFFKLIKIDYIPTIFNLSLVLGLLSLWISLLFDK